MDPLRLIGEIDLFRAIFWAAVFGAIWAALRPSRIRPARAETRSEGWSLGDASLIRCLLLFNLVFAAQTGLDLVYLLGGAALPEGMSYAEYAHRGAYPLILVALLSAAFVLIGFGPKAGRMARVLVAIWLAQNAWLVAMAVYRLALYVAAYGLTHLRLAAAIWMGLVALGLLLILYRVLARRTGRWLVDANLIAGAAVLLISASLNFTAIVSGHNVDAWLRDSRRIARIDIDHLMSLGAHSIPAVDTLLVAAKTLSPEERKRLRLWRAECDHLFRERMTDWRAWTLHDARLAAYLSATPAPQLQHAAPTPRIGPI